MDLIGKRVLVTGGAVRVGAEICRAFARAGANVTIHYNNSKNEATTLLDELGGESKGHSIYQCDLTQLKKLRSIFSYIGKIDILINNASTFFMGSFSDETFEDARKQFDVNYWAPVELMRAFSSQDITEGNIINILDQRIDKVDPIG